jgi:hypothetical protein
MSTVLAQRCFNHQVREAVARCPECRQFFCRECITEHEDRVLCTACLRNRTMPQSTRRRSLAGFARGTQAVVGLLLAWFFFFLVGQGLVQLSDSFHEGTMWKVPWLQK